MADQIDTSLSNSFRSLSKASGALTALVGIAVLIGWLFEISLLKSVFTEAVTMKPNTAVSFILIGASLWLALPGKGSDQRTWFLSQGCAGAVALVGVLTLSEYLFGRDLGIDQLLFKEASDALGTYEPGRMAPNTALNFILLGSSLLLLDLRTGAGYRIMQFFTLTAMLIGFLGLLGYVYGVSSLYGFSNFTRMAIHTALIFVIFSLGVLFARPEKGLMTIIAGKGVGGVLARRLLPAAVVVPLVLGSLVMWGERAHLYNDAFGDSLMVAGSVVAFCILILTSSRILARTDADLMQALKTLRQSNDELEDRVRERTAQIQLLLDSTAEAIYGLDVSGNCTFFNSACVRILGYRGPSDLIGKNMHDLIHYKRADGTPYHGVDCPISQAFQRGEKIHVDDEVNWRADGTSFAAEYWSRPLMKDGRIIGAVVTFIDITERRRAEEALRKSEKLYRLLAENTNDMITCLLPDSTYLYISPACRTLFGYESEELVGTKAFELIHPDDVKRLTFLTQKAVKAGGTTMAQYRHRKKDGQYIWVETVGRVVKNEETGNIEDIICAVRDISERKEAEEALRASEAELHDNYFAQSAINMILSESLEDVPLEVILQKALNMILSIPWISFESIGSIHLVEDEPGTLVMKAQNSLPKALIELCAQIPFGKCLCGRAALTKKIEFADSIDERHEICYEGMIPHGHYSVPILFGGKTLGVLNIYLKEGHVRNRKEEEFLLAVADTLSGIIARKKMEDEKEKLHHQLLQAQKMEAIGQLAGGIAHDFNNILTAIISYGSLLKLKMKEDDPLSSYADHILSSSERAANLTHSLLAFSRKQIMNPMPVDLNQIIRKVEKLLARIIGEDIELKTVLTGRDLTVMADPVQMEQVFMNLATNARDAMPKGGQLEIETGLAELDEAFVRTHGYGKAGSYALISVSDSGMGMDEKTSEKIFEPFFTTKEVGKGTGLGLSMVYGIIKQHDGFINVYSEIGRGTIFRIYLPLLQARAEEMRPEVIDTIKRGSETILLVEDNSEVRASTKALLEEFGYKIIEATDGEDAIVQFNRYKDGVKLVILDVIMPKKNGREAYEDIRKIKPAVRAVFTSGYTANIIHQKGILSEGFEFLHKPISPEALLRKVREILDKDGE